MSDQVPVPAEPRPRRGGVLLSDLMAVPRFGLVLHTAHARASTTVALGAHSVEIAEPTRWLSPGWIVITTGMRLRANVQAQRALVRELAGRGMAALGYASGVQTRGVPAALIDEGERLDFPVFEIPLETAVVDVIDHVRRCALRDDPEFLQQMVDTHAHLAGITEAFDHPPDESPEHALMRRLRMLVSARLSITDEAGTQTWPEPARLPRSLFGLLEQAAHDDIVTLPSPGGRTSMAFPIAYGRRRYGWILAAWQHDPDPRDVPLIRAVANLASFLHGTHDLSPAHLSTLQHELLVRLLQGRPYSEDLVERAGLLGFIEGEERRVLLVTAERNPHLAWQNLSKSLVHMRIPHLSLRQEDWTIALVQASDETLHGLLDHIVGMTVLVGRGVTRLGDFNLSHESAMFLRMRGPREDGEQPGVQWWEDLTISAWMFSSADRDERRRRAERFLTPLSGQPLLLDAVAAFLEHDLDVSAASKSLFLHPNSLRYRLGRAESLLGGTLRQPMLIADLYAALVEVGRLPPR